MQTTKKTSGQLKPASNAIIKKVHKAIYIDTKSAESVLTKHIPQTFFLLVSIRSSNPWEHKSAVFISFSQISS